MNVKVFNSMSRVNETRFLAQYESPECKCRLYKSVIQNKNWIIMNASVSVKI